MSAHCSIIDPGRLIFWHFVLALAEQVSSRVRIPVGVLPDKHHRIRDEGVTLEKMRSS